MKRILDSLILKFRGFIGLKGFMNNRYLFEAVMSDEGGEMRDGEESNDDLATRFLLVLGGLGEMDDARNN